MMGDAAATEPAPMAGPAAAPPSAAETHQQQQQHHHQQHPNPQPEPPSQRRAVCPACARPATVCLCASFPQQPLRLRGACAILQHPAEAKQKFATVPLLRKSLDARDFFVERGRRFDAERSAPRLHALLRRAEACSAPVLVLWPRAGVSVSLAQAMAEAAEAKAAEEATKNKKQRTTTDAEGDADTDAADTEEAPLAYLLVAIDGTWVQAQEMSGPLAKWIVDGRRARLVHLDADAAGDPSLRWRTEPLAAGMSTCEAVARALEVCEVHAMVAESGGGEVGDEEAAAAAAAATATAAAKASAAELRAALVRPLAKLVEIQVRYDPAMRARTGLGGVGGGHGDGVAAVAEGGGGGDGDDGGGDGSNYIRPSRRFRTARRARAGLPGCDGDEEEAAGGEAEEEGGGEREENDKGATPPPPPPPPQP